MYQFAFLKANLFYNQDRSVRPTVRDRQLYFVNLGMLELSYRFKTLHGDSCIGCSSQVRFEKRSNSNCYQNVRTSILIMLNKICDSRHFKLFFSFYHIVISIKSFKTSNTSRKKLFYKNKICALHARKFTSTIQTSLTFTQVCFDTSLF